jgi:hypothetical protein
VPDRPTLAADAATAKLEDFLQKLPLGARRSFLSLRALLSNLGPDVTETVRDAEVVYARARAFVIARLQRGRLLAVFPDGEQLDDPLGRLLRKGRERYVRLEDADDLDAHLQEFARKAYVLARGAA